MKRLLLPLAALIGLAGCSDSSPTGSRAGLDTHPGQVLIAAAGKTFTMGSDSSWIADSIAASALSTAEASAHLVTLTRSFWMDTTEVTQHQYDSVMTAHYGSYSISLDATYGKGRDYPVYDIFETGWGAGGAILYANARSALAGLDSVYTYTKRSKVSGDAVLTGLKQNLSRNGYRLPTEAEWEYAARGGTSTDMFWGMNYSPSAKLGSGDSAVISRYAVWAGNSYGLGNGVSGYGTHVVASGKPNAFGLYDMLGNVSEWCTDMWTSGYAATAATDPVDTTTEETYHAVRGGNWGNDLKDLRASNRTLTTAAYQVYFVGFRTVRNAD